MSIDQFHTAFKLELDKTDSLNYVSFLPEEIDYWLSLAVVRFVKTRYSGFNNKGEGFEQSQKRIDDLRTLIVEEDITTTVNSTTKPYSYNATLPFNYWFTVGEEVMIYFEYIGYSDSISAGASVLTVNSVYKVKTGTVTYMHGMYENPVTYSVDEMFVADYNGTLSGTGTVVKLYGKRVGITEVTTDRYRDMIDNPFSYHRLHYYDARPLRLFYNDHVELVSDGTYYIADYYLRYIKRPNHISDWTKEVEQFPEFQVYEGNAYAVTGGIASYNGINYSSGTTFTGVANMYHYHKQETTCVVTELSKCNLPEHTHDEIVKLAVSMVVENVGDTQRYQTNTIELSKME